MANRHSFPPRPDTSAEQVDRSTALRDDIAQSGYYPEVVADGLRDALAGEPVESYVIHQEPTFDRDEVRRHMTVVVLTPSRLVVAHTDEHPPDDLLPEPYTSTTTEAVSLGTVASVLVTRMVATAPSDDAPRGGVPNEALLTVGWGAVRRVDLEPAQCADPECDADHGYAGSTTADDFSLRVSAAADGGAAVERLLRFAGALSAATTAVAAR